MNTLQLLWAEIRYRKLTFALSVVAVTVAAALFVAGPILLDGYSRETQARVAALEKQTASILAELEEGTRRLMRDLGFNLLIVPKGTNMSDLWASDFAATEMPQEYVVRLARDRRLTYVTHLVATLAGKTTFERHTALLVGYLPETSQSHINERKPMGYNIQAGAVLLGYELHGDHKVGDSIEVQGKKFTIAKLLDEQGSKDDITIAMHLSDAQALLNKPGKINQILALGCNCAGSNLPNIRRQLGEILPEAQITEFRSKAIARAEQRALVAQQQQKLLDDLTASRAQVQSTLETMAAVVVPPVVLACAVWIGLLALGNVRQRRTEIGLLRALGRNAASIGLLLLGKSCVVGLIGGGLGFAVGAGLAWLLGTRALAVSAGLVGLRLDMLGYCLLGAPLVAVIASYLPTLWALREDPAVALREV